MKFLVIDGCPCPADVAPFVYLVLRKAGQTATAVYRGDDPAAVAILHAHGKHTQRELYNATPAQRKAWGVEGMPNKPGYSQHELFSDGRANPHVPAGGALKPWQVGVDSGTDTPASKKAVEDAADSYGWHVHHPYDSNIEGHHWCFVSQPHAHGLTQRLLIAKTKRVLSPKRTRPPVKRAFGVRGLALVKQSEGFRATAYKPTPGERYWTIGYGHCGPDVTKGMVITEQVGEKLLQQDVAQAVLTVNQLVTTHVNQNRFDALVSFCFNVGAGQFKTSTLLKLVNERKFGRAVLEFAKWVRGADGPLPGLVIRRAREAALFVRPPLKGET